MDDSLVVEEDLHHRLACLTRSQGLLGTQIILANPLAAFGFEFRFQNTEPGFIPYDDTPQEKWILAFSQIVSADVHSQFLLLRSQDAGNELWSLLFEIQVLAHNVVNTACQDLSDGGVPILVQNTLHCSNIGQIPCCCLSTGTCQILSTFVSSFGTDIPTSAGGYGKSIIPVDLLKKVKGFPLRFSSGHTCNDVVMLCTAELHVAIQSHANRRMR